jgi:hypothetical protein
VQKEGRSVVLKEVPRLQTFDHVVPSESSSSSLLTDIETVFVSLIEIEYEASYEAKLSEVQS